MIPVSKKPRAGRLGFSFGILSFDDDQRTRSFRRIARQPSALRRNETLCFQAIDVGASAVFLALCNSHNSYSCILKNQQWELLGSVFISPSRPSRVVSCGLGDGP